MIPSPAPEQAGNWTPTGSSQGMTEWHLDDGHRAAVFHTLPGESVMYEDGENSFLIEHDDGDVYVVTIGPLAHLTPIWRQWARWEAGP